MSTLPPSYTTLESFSTLSELFGTILAKLDLKYVILLWTTSKTIQAHVEISYTHLTWCLYSFPSIPFWSPTVFRFANVVDVTIVYDPTCGVRQVGPLVPAPLALYGSVSSMIKFDNKSPQGTRIIWPQRAPLPDTALKSLPKGLRHLRLVCPCSALIPEHTNISLLFESLETFEMGSIPSDAVLQSLPSSLKSLTIGHQTIISSDIKAASLQSIPKTLHTLNLINLVSNCTALDLGQFSSLHTLKLTLEEPAHTPVSLPSSINHLVLNYYRSTSCNSSFKAEFNGLTPLHNLRTLELYAPTLIHSVALLSFLPKQLEHLHVITGAPASVRDEPLPLFPPKLITFNAPFETMDWIDIAALPKTIRNLSCNWIPGVRNCHQALAQSRTAGPLMSISRLESMVVQLRPNSNQKCYCSSGIIPSDFVTRLHLTWCGSDDRTNDSWAEPFFGELPPLLNHLTISFPFIDYKDLNNTGIDWNAVASLKHLTTLRLRLPESRGSYGNYTTGFKWITPESDDTAIFSLLPPTLTDLTLRKDLRLYTMVKPEILSNLPSSIICLDIAYYGMIDPFSIKHLPRNLSRLVCTMNFVPFTFFPDSGFSRWPEEFIDQVPKIEGRLPMMMNPSTEVNITKLWVDYTRQGGIWNKMKSALSPWLQDQFNMSASHRMEWPTSLSSLTLNVLPYQIHRTHYFVIPVEATAERQSCRKPPEAFLRSLPFHITYVKYVNVPKDF